MVDMQRPPALPRRPCSGETLRCSDIQIKGTHFRIVLEFWTDLIAKVTYDLHQVDPSNLPRLRDTLITALERYQSGPKTIIVQISLALSGLALQLPSWKNAVQGMMDSFGRNPATVPALLQFLTVLPEELAGNSKIPITVSCHKSACPTGRVNLIIHAG
jgi:hypothetical protein